MRLLVKLGLIAITASISGRTGSQVNALTLSGFVVDKNSRPVEGANVTVVGNKAKADTTTDSEGAFVVSLAQGVQEGNTVRVVVEKPGYKPYQKLCAVSSAIPLRIPLEALASPPPSETHQSVPRPKLRAAGSIELRVFGPSEKGHFSGYWMKWNAEPCTISPVNALLFIRIVNTQATKVAFTGYQVASMDQTSKKLVPLKKLDLRAGYLLWTAPKGERNTVPHVGNTLNLPGKCGYFMNRSQDDAAYESAGIINLPLLDDQLAEKTLDPGAIARGWAAFEFQGTPDMRGRLLLTIYDASGNQYPVTISKLSRSKDVCLGGDIMPHLMTVTGLADVSGCEQKPF